MEVTIESTDRFGSVGGNRARIWKGLTDGGVVVSVLVPFIMTIGEVGDEFNDLEEREPEFMVDVKVR